MITFSPICDAFHGPAVSEMMRGLYQEDPASHPVDEAHFQRTIAHLLAHPEAGQIVLFMDGKTPAGYAVLISYWSNEFGGNLLFIDELFVSQSHRGKGIAKQFFGYLEQNPPAGTVALALEVTPANAKARGLYESLGFAKRKNDVLIKRLSER
jgi:GNAT superfamily N-acetyltransferase